MLNNATGFRKIYIAAGYTDLRRGIDGLASIIKFNFPLDPYEKDTLFLFCGRRSDRIKGLVWEGDGFLLLYKRLELGDFSWPRTKEEALEITPEQYQALMQGLGIVSRHPIQEVHPQDLLQDIVQNGENQKSFRIRRPGQIGSYPQQSLIAFIQSWSTYRQQAAVWISTLKN